MRPGSTSDPPSTPEAAPVRVVVVDDHAPFLRVARDVIAATSGFEPVGDASSGPEALTLVDEASPGLVLVDVQMPGMDGIATAREIVRRHPGAVVVLVSAHDPAQIPSAARTCGAVAVVRKQDLRPELLRTLWRDHGG